MDILYIPDRDYVDFVRAHDGELVNHNGGMRWICVIDGKRTMVRPESAKV